jgi:DNA-binding transcriptional LysR family regulator
MRFTLRQLEVFLAIARSESVSRAAKDLAMSQSAASGALADLERQFDIQLFERVGKRLQLSGIGRALRGRAESLQEQARELEQGLGSHGDVAELRVGATMSIGNYLMAPLIAQFVREHPSSRIALDVANTAEIARMVLNYEIDVGLIEGELQDSDLDVTRWRPDELVVFCAPNHPFAKRRTLRDEDLKAASWIVRERGSGTRQAFEHAMHGILPELRIGLELQHTEGIKSAVKAGLGVGCVSRIALDDAFRHKSLVPCSVPHRDFKRYFFFVLRKQKYRSAGLENWLALCRKA